MVLLLPSPFDSDTDSLTPTLSRGEREFIKRRLVKRE
jgi:hypothetical protein